MSGYPWATGDALLAADLNAAIANSAAYGPFLPISGGAIAGSLGFWGTSSTINSYDAKLWVTGGATVAGNPGQGVLNYMAGQHTFQAWDGTTQFRVGNVPWGWGFWEASAGNTGTAAILRTVSDLTPDFNGAISVQGHASLAFGNGEGTLLNLPPAGAPIINYFQLEASKTNTEITIRAAGGDGLPCTIKLHANYNGAFLAENANGRLFIAADGQPAGTTALSYLRATTENATTPMTLSVTGVSGADHSFNISSAGNGEIAFLTGGGKQMRVGSVASATAIVEIFGAVTGGCPIIRSSAGQLFLGVGSHPTTSTAGFVQFAGSAGAPTGVPVNAAAGPVISYDTTNNRLYVYNGAAWRSVALT